MIYFIGVKFLHMTFWLCLPNSHFFLALLLISFWLCFLQFLIFGMPGPCIFLFNFQHLVTPLLDSINNLVLLINEIIFIDLYITSNSMIYENSSISKQSNTEMHISKYIHNWSIIINIIMMKFWMQLIDIHLNYPYTLKDGFYYEELGIICTNCLGDGRLDIFLILGEFLLIREEIRIDSIEILLLLILGKVRLSLLDRWSCSFRRLWSCRSNFFKVMR